MKRYLAAAGLAAGLWVGLAAPAGAFIIVGGHVDVVIGNPDTRVHLKVSLPCPGTEQGFNPQLDPPGREAAILDLRGGGSSFHLTAVEAASCSNNLHQGRGVGSCNGEGGFIINWRITDGALGGPDTRPDSVVVEIDGDGRTCPLAVAGPLGGGNLKMTAPPEPD